jgi:hypothetical protein
MAYTLLIYEPTAKFAERKDPAKAQATWATWQAYTQALIAAGVMTGGAGLEPPEAATTVRLVHGDRQVQDGPYADTKEQLGGYYVIDVPDLDAALAWAARCPAAAYGTVEVRPNMKMG